MSRLVTSSPTSGDTSSTPAASSRAATSPNRTNSSSYLVAPRPLTRTAARPLAPSGRSASTASTRLAASSAAGIQSAELIPGSPWMPSPKSIWPGATLNSGSSEPGIVQPANATPKENVAALAARISRSTSSRSAPSSAAAPPIL